MPWCEFLGYVSGPGVSAVAGIALSVVAEYVAAFAALEARYKRIAFLVACMALPLAAAGLGVWTCGLAASWAGTFWPAIVAGGLAFGSGTLVHTRKIGNG